MTSAAQKELSSVKTNAFLKMHFHLALQLFIHLMKVTDTIIMMTLEFLHLHQTLPYAAQEISAVIQKKYGHNG